ncbi:tyrosine-type recombinase/integrase [Chloroflexota bacterium]
MNLRQKCNDELFTLYDSDIILRLRNAKNLSDTRKILTKFKQYLNQFPPSSEIAKAFLAPFADRKPRTLYRYAQMIKAFMKWYGEPMNDFHVKVPKSLPTYASDQDIEKLFKAIENKKTHKGCIVRDSLMTELTLRTGMRRSELANLAVKDVHADFFLVVKNGKGGKDRVIPLVVELALRLHNFIRDKQPDEKVFKLKPASITMKIKKFARAAGLTDLHAHTLRHKFATDLLERGANLKVVQQLLGHENLATTEVYLSITDQSLRDAIGLLDSKAKKPALKKKIDQDKPAWVQAFDEMAKDGKNYGLGLDGSLHEV